ncbi:MAG: hypothetical protein ACYDH5_04180 [Acidimicrobiales bacterium]
MVARTMPVPAPMHRASQPGKGLARALAALEGLAMLAAPAAAYLVLRLRVMAPVGLPDPSMSTTYVIDPRDIFLRYSAVFNPTARLREAARVGFLVPARLSYLAFGAVPGFLVFRYVLALVAAVPAYLLLKRLYGRPAGALGVIVVLSSPVVVTAFGTDFPDSAVVAYLLGALACLGMSYLGRRRAWLAAVAVLATMAVWALATSVPLIGVTFVVYLALRGLRDREGLWGDLALMAGVSVAVTVALGVASGVLIGQFDYILPTVKSLLFLARPSQEAIWHSASWRWAPYDAYLLVPPAVLGVWLVAFARRWGSVPTPALLVGLSCAAQLTIASLLQFAGSVQVLEMHFFSSTLWGSVCLALAVALAELAGSRLLGRALAWEAPALLLAVPLAYEWHPAAPAMTWLPAGALLAGAMVLGAVAGRASAAAGHLAVRAAGAGAAIVAVTVAGLVLTVAQSPPHPPLPHTVADPYPAYAGALGGQAAGYIGMYKVTTEVAGFAGNATYPGEQLVMCVPSFPELVALIEPIGIFHAGFNLLPGNTCTGAAALHYLSARRPAQLLMMSQQRADPQAVLRSLRPAAPVLVRSTVLRSGPIVLRLWLFDLNAYMRPGAARTAGTP